MLALLLTWCLATYLRDRPVDLEVRVIAGGNGRPLRILIFSPQGTVPSGGRPAVVAIPPYSLGAATMELACRELVSRGALCAVPDFFGREAQESRQHLGQDALEQLTADVVAVLAALKAHPAVDETRLAVFGHSVGGTLAILSGMREPSVQAVVALGIVGDFLPTRPRNLLFLSGIHDEVHSPASILGALAENGVSASPSPDTLYGTVVDGSARQASFVGTADHFTEPVDPVVLKRLRAWLAQALAAPALAEERPSAVAAAIARTALALAAGAGWAWLCRRASRGWRRVAAQSPVGPSWDRGLFGGLLGALAVAVLWAGARWPEHGALSLDVLLLACLGHTVALGAPQGRAAAANTRAFLVALGWVGLALGGAFAVSYAVAALPTFLRAPAAALDYPRFLLHLLVLFPLKVWERTRAWLAADALGTQPGLFTWVLVAVAVFSPRWPLEVMRRAARAVLVAVRAGGKGRRPSQQPVSRALQPPRSKPPSSTGALRAATLVALLGVLAYVLQRRAAEGMLTAQSVGLVAEALLRFALVPPLFWLALRTETVRAAVDRGLAPSTPEAQPEAPPASES